MSWHLLLSISLALCWLPNSIRASGKACAGSLDADWFAENAEVLLYMKHLQKLAAADPLDSWSAVTQSREHGDELAALKNSLRSAAAAASGAEECAPSSLLERLDNLESRVAAEELFTEQLTKQFNETDDGDEEENKRAARGAGYYAGGGIDCIPSSFVLLMVSVPFSPFPVKKKNLFFHYRTPFDENSKCLHLVDCGASYPPADCDYSPSCECEPMGIEVNHSDNSCAISMLRLFLVLFSTCLRQFSAIVAQNPSSLCNRSRVA